MLNIGLWSKQKLIKQKKLLEGNVVVITGSTGTIGFETYKMFKSYGAEVVLLDFNRRKTKKTCRSKIKDTLYLL